MKLLLEKIIAETKKYTKEGNVATYIPELGRMDRDISGVAIVDINNNVYIAGDTDTKFTIQSMSKPIALLLALMDNGEEVFDKVGKEPSGDSFNSLKRLATHNTDIPFNPMVNAGAIVVTSMIKGNSKEEKFNRILNFFKKMTGNNNLSVNIDVFNSELKTGDKNRSIAYFLKDNNIIEGDVHDSLETYFKQCSIEVTCTDLAYLGATLANDGVSVITNERIIPSRYATITKALMFTCGMYDDSGSFAVEVGIPAKSGVSGGIFSAIPNKMGIGVIGPSLDLKGNSIVGIKILNEIVNVKKLSLFS
ncbi:glutaminase A [Clostridiaceae bacterium HSG29]|nr:glutaminase A [Clostridiaceae bacterium HSG29]